MHLVAGVFMVSKEGIFNGEPPAGINSQVEADLVDSHVVGIRPVDIVALEWIDAKGWCVNSRGIALQSASGTGKSYPARRVSE
jgi:hypothetical protein